MDQLKKNKARTAITIDPDLWEAARIECERRTEVTGRKVSFSAFVEECIQNCLTPAEQ